MDIEAKSIHPAHQTSVLPRLVDLIERNAAELTNNWLAQIHHDASLPTYHRFDSAELYSRAFRVYSQLGKWISRETTKEDIARDYIALGPSGARRVSPSPKSSRRSSSSAERSGARSWTRACSTPPTSSTRPSSSMTGSHCFLTARFSSP
jgi:hypothetical protein